MLQFKMEFLQIYYMDSFKSSGNNYKELLLEKLKELELKGGLKK